MDNSNKIPKVDHGVDVCGDEWDELEEEPKMSSKIEMEKRYDPAHPYCTNWPVNKKKGEDEKV